MKTDMEPRRTRHSAEERRAEILQAAVSQFALYGLHGTSTETIAAQVGISQPYIFRLFGTKKELFLAAIDYVYSAISEGFRAAIERDPVQPLDAMKQSYTVLLTRRTELLVLLHAFAAAEDDEIRQRVRHNFAELYRLVREGSGASVEEVRDFFARGMLLTIAAAIRAPELLLSDEWVNACLGIEAEGGM